MPAELIDGAALAAGVLDRVSSEVAARVAAGFRPPSIVTVLVGDDPSSHTYVRMKVNRARKAGIDASRMDLPASTTTAELIAVIEGFSRDPGVDGILLQHPVPDHIDERAAFEAIAADKDVDGVTHESFARMAFNEGGFDSATPGGILRLLEAYEVPIAGTDTIVIGQGPILGKPLGMLLVSRGATVVLCHRLTHDLATKVAAADLVIAATGVPELVKGAWIKPGAVVIDAGYSAGNVGDVEFAAAAERASKITPVPGGVGPMTIAVLLEQTLTASKAHLG